MYDRKCYVDIRLLGCALVLLVMALLTIHTGLDKKAVTAAADPAPAAVSVSITLPSSKAKKGGTT